MWDAAPEDEAWGELLLAAGRLVWEAGPLRDAPGLCHGTAGNAYALLALWRRTGDERWLERARAFAQHAAGQVEERAARLGHGRHSLFTGDEGVALCLASCVAGDERLPVADRLI
jgi:lantibiotic modifying enzyme